MHPRNTRSDRRFSPDKMQKVTLAETPNFFADIYCLEPGQEQKPHGHPGSDKIYYVIEGTGTFSIAGDEQSLGPDNLVHAPAGVEHGVRNDSSAQLVLLVFMAPNPNY